MRLISTGLLVASLAAGACNRTESVAAATPDAKSVAAAAAEPNAASDAKT